MAMTPEGRVKNKIKKWLKDRGVWFFMPIGGPFTTHGVPDFICCVKGRFLAIEAKAPGKRKNVTANQERKIHEIQSAGGMALVVDDAEQLGELERALKDLGML